MSGAARPPDARTRTCDIWLEDRGVVHARFVRDADVDLADARENIDATLRLSRGARAPVLVDLREVRSQTAEARGYFSGPDASRIATAVALLIGSPLSRVLGNFYLRFNRPEAPTRLFSDEDEARAWLLEAAAGETPRRSHGT